MANARAIANGNWSATSTWNGGVVPGNGDTVYANGFNVTLDTDVTIGGANNPIVNTGSLVSGQWYEIVNVGGQNWTAIGAASNTTGTVFQSTGTGTAGNLGTARALATLTTATNTAAGATTGGGVFTMSTVRAMTADLRAGTTTCLNVTATSGTLTLSGLRVVSGSATGAHGVNTTANSDLASCTFTSGSGVASALHNASTGTVNVTGSCTFTGGVASAPALNNASTGSVTVTNSTFTASAFTNAVGIANTSADVRLSGDFLDHWSGWKAVNGAKWRLGTAPTLGQTRYALAGTTDSYFTEFGSDFGTFGNPIAANVRSGVVYGGGNLTGSCAVPAAGSVSFGVPVDNTTGTAILTQANVQSALTAQGLTSARAGNLDNLDTTVSSRLSPSGTLARVTLTDTATTLTNAPTVPTAAEIATAVEGSLLNEADGQAVLNAIVGAIGNTNLSEVSLVAAVRADLERTGGKLDNIPTTSAPSASAVAGAVRTELGVELGRLDASVSSRLSPSGTLATVTNLTNAPASVTPSDIWSHSSRTLTTSSGPTAAEIRQEMDSSSSKLANLDAAISSRMAASEASKLDSIKGKTDLLNTDRLSQVATTNIVGTLLAQANS
ncbi:MAG: hypothetical protein NTW41_05510 [Verrucomicrobia bacterium]|nr:hypothetical protein [Verrucomicrobiota bacterium]